MEKSRKVNCQQSADIICSFLERKLESAKKHNCGLSSDDARRLKMIKICGLMAYDNEEGKSREGYGSELLRLERVSKYLSGLHDCNNEKLRQYVIDQIDNIRTASFELAQAGRDESTIPYEAYKELDFNIKEVVNLAILLENIKKN